MNLFCLTDVTGNVVKSVISSSHYAPISSNKSRLFIFQNIEDV